METPTKQCMEKVFPTPDDFVPNGSLLSTVTIFFLDLSTFELPVISFRPKEFLVQNEESKSIQNHSTSVITNSRNEPPSVIATS